MLWGIHKTMFILCLRHPQECDLGCVSLNSQGCVVSWTVKPYFDQQSSLMFDSWYYKKQSWKPAQLACWILSRWIRTLPVEKDSSCWISTRSTRTRSALPIGEGLSKWKGYRRKGTRRSSRGACHYDNAMMEASGLNLYDIRPQEHSAMVQIARFRAWKTWGLVSYSRRYYRGVFNEGIRDHSRVNE